MTSYKKVWWISLFIKLLIAARLPLSADEAYYWVWSHFPQLSYFDHPPAVAWLFKLGSFFPDPFIRWPTIILFHLGFLFWFQILKPRLSEKEIFTWLILCLLCPLMGLGPVLVLPDSPLFFFFSGSLFFFFQALQSPRFLNFAGFGALLGLGFLSKYLIVIPAGLFVLFILTEKNKAPLKIRNLLPILVFGFLFSSPVLIWNWQNDFKSFQFQLQHGLSEGPWQWTWTTDYIFGSLLLLFPWNFYLALKAPKNFFNKVFSFLALGGLLFFVLSSFKGSVELNWPSIFYPCLFVLSVQTLSSRLILKNIAYWCSLYAAIGILLATGAAPSLSRKLQEPLQATRLSNLPSEYAPLYTSTYQLAALLWWTSQKPVYKLRDSGRYDFFDEQSLSRPSASTFYLIKEAGNNLPDWLQSKIWSIQEMQKPDDTHIVLKITKKDPP